MKLVIKVTILDRSTVAGIWVIVGGASFAQTI